MKIELSFEILQQMQFPNDKNDFTTVNSSGFKNTILIPMNQLGFLH